MTLILDQAIMKMTLTDIFEGVKRVKEKVLQLEDKSQFTEQERKEITRAIEVRIKYFHDRYGRALNQQAVKDMRCIANHVVDRADSEWLKALRLEWIHLIQDGIRLDACEVILRLLRILEINEEEKQLLPKNIEFSDIKMPISNLYRVVLSIGHLND